MVAPKLQKGNGVRIIAPARSLAMPSFTKELLQQAQQRLEALGLIVSFSKNVHAIDEFYSSSVEQRVEDIHEAFSDSSVQLILTVIGGYNSNQLLPYLNYDLLASNSKIICGYSDITALGNAIYAKTGLVTYSGPHFSTFGMKEGFEYTLEYFKKCLFSNEPLTVRPAEQWSDDAWFKDQANRSFSPTEDYWVFNPGKAEGTIIGGNLCTLNLLQGTEFMPDISNSVLFIEDDSESQPATFDRDLQSLIHQPHFETVSGMVIGRFQRASNMTKSLLQKIIESKQELKNLPIMANIDFGHTSPMITFPIGGQVSIEASATKTSIEISKH